MSRDLSTIYSGHLGMVTIRVPRRSRETQGGGKPLLGYGRRPGTVSGYAINWAAAQAWRLLLARGSLEGSSALVNSGRHGEDGLSLKAPSTSSMVRSPNLARDRSWVAAITVTR